MLSYKPIYQLSTILLIAVLTLSTVIIPNQHSSQLENDDLMRPPMCAPIQGDQIQEHPPDATSSTKI